MNQKLQNILKILEQKQNLSAEEKESAIKALKNADKEFEITAFKLERTEKVKKTTAILLEETIEELEQKRKAVEAQNRELEIEASLERVRTVAMGMNKSDDLLSICEVSFKEFKKLGFDNLRNAIIHILNDEKGFFLDYDYSDYLGGSINHINYNSHPVVEDYLRQIKKADDAFAQVVIEGTELDGWKEFRRSGGQVDDPKLDGIQSLYYYLFSIGIGDIGISTFSPIDDTQIKILKRFRNVFDLAYRRYNDIALAEVQAREAQIELALERVRARAMAMQKSDELLEVGALLYQGLFKLGIQNLTCGYVLMDQEKKIGWNYGVNPGDGTIKPQPTGIPQSGTKILQLITESWEKQEPFLLFKLDPQETINHQTYIAENCINFPFSAEKLLSISPKRLVIHTFNFKQGYLLIVGGIVLTTQQQEMVIRFAKVFEQTYTRFLDLQKAEAQAREAQIELALERVRARTMAMQKSEELSETASVLFQQFKELGEDPDQLSIGIVNESEKVIEIWLSLQGNIMNQMFKAPIDEPTVINKIYTAWKEKRKSVIIDISGEELEKYNRYLNSDVDFKEYKDVKNRIGRQEHRRIIYTSLFSKGLLSVATQEPRSEETIKILERFAGVFDGTYTRFLDLKKAEAQAKESQIEAALERVRSRSMAMHKSDELGDLSFELVKQVQTLGIETWFCAFNIYDDDPEGSLEWGSNAEGTYKEYRTPREGIFLRYWEAGQRGESLLINEIDEKECPGHYEYLCSLPGVGEQLLQMKDAGISFPTSQIDHVAYFKYGYIIFITFEPAPEAHDIFKRFAKVFEQTYTRFLDLKKAEAQAREAQIEASLEKVRTVALSLKKSDEMLDIAQVLYEQLIELGFTNIRNAIIDIHNDTNETFLDYDYSHDMGRTVTLMSYYDDPIIEKQVRQIESSSDAFFEIILEGQDLQDLIDIRLKNGEDEDPRLRQIEQLTYNLYSFGNGAIGISNFGLLSDEQKIVLKRFRNVFAFAYKRYNDLVRAENQAREAQIEAALERVRSKTMAMHKSDELADTAGVLFEQMVSLGIVPKRCIISIINQSTNNASFWLTGSDGKVIPGSDLVPLTEEIHLIETYQAWKEKKTHFSFKVSGEERLSWTLYVMNKAKMHLPEYQPDTINKEMILNEPALFNCFFFSHGFVMLHTVEDLSEEHIKMLKRFANVFEQTYTRFLDLQKAEAQARESQIEAALERVRSRAMSMHSPNDLSETVNVFFKELKTLGIIPIRCGVGQIDESTRTTSLTTTTSSQQGESFRVIGKVKQTGHPVLDGIFDHWKLQKEYHPVLEGEDIKAYYNVMNAQIGYPEYPEGVTQYGNNFFFTEGFVFAWTENLLSEEELIIFRRFTSVLSLTYRRYLDLKEAEERNKIIQAENDRKTKELEEARQLQLSLLPRTLPQLPQFEIAVYMKTATEVGGDYYDFNVQPNGVLNIGIGDATGHGLQAGTMITLMKGFFTADVAKFSPQKFLEHCNGIIRDIRLGRILMSFSHLRFENSKLLISSAGMPPVYYHHKKNNRTEEIIIQGLPLGAMGSASYKLVEKQLNSGDTILLLTDGLPEQMNNHKVIFDYSRVLKCFDEIAETDPNEIINRLVQKADDWMDGQKQSDDVTFVVIKVK
jgi:hypothetical protein